MESTKTIQLKIIDVDNDLVETMQKYSEGMNYVSEVVFQNGKVIPARKLQGLVYSHLRESIGLKSQVSCNIPRQVAGSYKTLLEQIKCKKTKWQKLQYTQKTLLA